MFGGLDILVTNSGGPPSGTVMTLDEAAWLDAIDSLLLSVVRLCRGAIPYMQPRRS
jgi:3-oxoacyl-[acyl-carrier protein] reductase